MSKCCMLTVTSAAAQLDFLSHSVQVPGLELFIWKVESCVNMKAKQRGASGHHSALSQVHLNMVDDFLAQLYKGEGCAKGD